jgi:hypothetical protein
MVAVMRKVAEAMVTSEEKEGAGMESARHQAVTA